MPDHTPAGPGGPPPAPSLITPELLAAFRVGEVSGRYTFLVTRERIKRFTGVLTHRTQEEQVVFDGDLGDGPPLPAPTVFFAALDPLELRIMSHDYGLDLIPHRRTGGGNAFNEIEYDRPILSGDLVTVAVTYTEIYERDGRSGRLLFRVRESVLTDRLGQRIAVTRSGHAYAFEVTGYQPPSPGGKIGSPEPGPADQGELLPPLTRTPTVETLIRYAAAADDYAPLHFDHNYALTRGYDGVIVHGFLKAGYLATMVEGWAGPGAFVKRFRAEYRGADYPGRPITCRGRVSRWHEEGGRRAADLALRTERADGSVSTRGSATVLFPD
jgi:acyl dehydratase